MSEHSNHIVVQDTGTPSDGWWEFVDIRHLGQFRCHGVLTVPTGTFTVRSADGAVAEIYRPAR